MPASKYKKMGKASRKSRSGTKKRPVGKSTRKGKKRPMSAGQAGRAAGSPNTRRRTSSGRSTPKRRPGSGMTKKSRRY